MDVIFKFILTLSTLNGTNSFIYPTQELGRVQHFTKHIFRTPTLGLLRRHEDPNPSQILQGTLKGQHQEDFRPMSLLVCHATPSEL